MLTVPELPLWLSITLAALLLIGSAFVFIGAMGLACFRNFYERLHMPTLGATMGAAAILAAAALYSSYRAGEPALRYALILFFLSLAAPISLMMLSRAAAMRDFTKSWRDDSDNMFWQLAHDKETRETDEDVEKEIERKVERAESAENAEAAAAAQAEDIAETAEFAAAAVRRSGKAKPKAKAADKKGKMQSAAAERKPAKKPAAKPRRPRQKEKA